MARASQTALGPSVTCVVSLSNGTSGMKTSPETVTQEIHRTAGVRATYCSQRARFGVKVAGDGIQSWVLHTCLVLYCRSHRSLFSAYARGLTSLACTRPRQRGARLPGGIAYHAALGCLQCHSPTVWTGSGCRLPSGAGLSDSHNTRIPLT